MYYGVASEDKGQGLGLGRRNIIFLFLLDILI